MTNKKADLEETIEQLRQQRYPDLPAGLVGTILSIEAACPENRVEAMRRIAEAIEHHLDGGVHAQN